jgi:hypothetical protein
LKHGLDIVDPDVLVIELTDLLLQLAGDLVRLLDQGSHFSLGVLDVVVLLLELDSHLLQLVFQLEVVGPSVDLFGAFDLNKLPLLSTVMRLWTLLALGAVLLLQVVLDAFEETLVVEMQLVVLTLQVKVFVFEINQINFHSSDQSFHLVDLGDSTSIDVRLSDLTSLSLLLKLPLAVQFISALHHLG